MANSSSTAGLDSIAQSATEVSPEFAALPKYQKQKWTQLMLSTIFRRISYKQLVARATRLFGRMDYKTMWRVTLADGYVVKNIKCWLFWCIKHGLRGAEAAVAAQQFEVRVHDLTLRLWLTRDCVQHLRRLAAAHPALKLQTLDARVVNIYQSMQDWLAKFVYRKMRFVYQQQGLDAHDMKMEVFAKGVLALYVTYPAVHTMLHATNIVKSAAHNYGINMVIQQTHDRRARLIVNADKTFGSRVVALDDRVIQELESLAVNDSRQQDLALDVERLFNKYPAKAQSGEISLRHLLYEADATTIPLMSKKQRLLAMLMGYEDWEFNQWLSTCHRIQSSSSEYLDRAEPQRFIAMACRFLNVPEDQGQKFIARVGFRLRDYSKQSLIGHKTAGSSLALPTSSISHRARSSAAVSSGC